MSAIEEASRYLSGANDDTADAAFEERMFRDPELARACSWLIGLRDALVGLAAQGPIVPVVTAKELTVIAAEQTVLECAPIDGIIEVTIGSEVAFIAARLPVRLDGTRSVDVEFCSPDGVPFFRVREAPCDLASNEVVVLCKRHVALASGDLRVVIRDDKGAMREVFSLRSREA